MPVDKRESLNTPIKIWYKQLPGSSPITKWPIIDVKFSAASVSLKPIASLVDSGADQSILHPQLAEVLGVNLGTLDFIKGGKSVSGNYDYYQLSNSIPVNIYGYEFNIKFTIINNPQLIWPCILGEDSIFQFARLDFQKFKGFFDVRFRLDVH